MKIITLVNGLSLTVSGTHPLNDQALVSSLEKGQEIKTSEGLMAIQSIETTPYSASYTYDLLPEGPSELYFANGVMLGSTLSRD